MPSNADLQSSFTPFCKWLSESCHSTVTGNTIPNACSPEKYKGFYISGPSFCLWHCYKTHNPSHSAAAPIPKHPLNSPLLACWYHCHGNSCQPGIVVPRSSLSPFKYLLIHKSPFLGFPFQRQNVGDYGSCLKMTTIFTLLLYSDA